MTTKVPKSQERVHKYISENGLVRVSSVLATDVVREMQSTLNAFPIASVALGRAMVGCVLMVSHLKEGHSVGVYFRGSGPLGTVYAESTFEGAVRAYTANPHVDLPNKNGRLNISDAIGIGLLEVVRGSPFQHKFHTGTVEIRTGEIGDDIAFYLQQSHQIPSVVALGVHLDRTGRVDAAGGVLVELMPGATEETMKTIEGRVSEVKSISDLIFSGATPYDLANAFMKDFKLEELGHAPHLRYECRCNEERVHRSLLLIGFQELDLMIAEQKPVHVTCDFCGRKYTVELSTLQELRAKSFRNSLN